MLFIFLTSGKEHIQDTEYEQEGLVQFVIDSVYALALAIHNLLRDRCHKPFKECLGNQQLAGEDVLKYIRNVTFTGKYGTWKESNLYEQIATLLTTIMVLRDNKQ